MVKNLNAELQKQQQKRINLQLGKTEKLLLGLEWFIPWTTVSFLNKGTCKNDKDNEKYPIRFSENGEMV